MQQSALPHVPGIPMGRLLGCDSHHELLLAAPIVLPVLLNHGMVNISFVNLVLMFIPHWNADLDVYPW